MTAANRRRQAPPERRPPVLLLAMMALLVACSDDDDQEKPPPTATSISLPTPTATPSGGPATTTPTTTPPLGTATATSTLPPASRTTPAATRTAIPTDTPGGVVIAIQSIGANAGVPATFEVQLKAGAGVVGTQNDIGFAPEAPIVARANGRPECTVNPEIDKGGTSFAFLPPSCLAGFDCTGVRALVLALDNVDPIDTGAVLYICTVLVSDSAQAARYPLTCSNAGASDADGNALATTCLDGEVGPFDSPISSPTPTAPLPPPTSTPTPLTGADGVVAPIGSAGRWFTDALGRVVLMHGVNMVSKRDPFYPAAFGFGDDDAAFLAENGFNAVRLGVDFRGLMPTPGVIETAYIDHLAETVATLVAHDLLVLMDFHQDGFAPLFNGNGLPDWMAISDGLPNPPDAVFPLYYIQNPAMQRAFENFWANREGPGGVGVQDYFLQGVQAVAARFAGEPRVLGTELMNEPWPGADWGPCALATGGCPDIEAERLAPFNDRGATAARAVAPNQLVFVEPFVLFNFGQADTTMPGPDERLALSFHSYALDVAGEEGVVARAVAAAERDQRPLICTEFGASVDPLLLNRITGQLEQAVIPWLFWSYDENITRDLAQPPGGGNLNSSAALEALVRPYPVAVAGTPTVTSFDPETNAFHFEYDTATPGGRPIPQQVLTVISVPARRYPDGYSVQVDGAEVASAPGAPLLLLRTVPDAAHVTVTITR